MESLWTLFMEKVRGVRESHISREESSISQQSLGQALLLVREHSTHGKTEEESHWAVGTGKAASQQAECRQFPATLGSVEEGEESVTQNWRFLRAAPSVPNREHGPLIMELWSVWPGARRHWKCPLENICFRLLPVWRKPHMLTLAFLLPSERRGFRLTDLKPALLA